LSPAARVVIADLRRDRLGVREIAVEIGRAPSTVSRELRRNLDETGQSQEVPPASRRTRL